MSAPIDCPICMDCIESTSKNCVTTDCGHCFHTNCLMQSVAHNGFGCPYCRTAMAEVPDEEETLYSDEDGDEDYEDEIEEEMFDDDALRGFRFFWNNLNGEEHDVDDEDEEEAFLDESEFDWEEFRNRRAPNANAANVPSPAVVAQKLQEQGVTFEQLVLQSLTNHREYVPSSEVDLFIYAKIRRIISTYTPEQSSVQVQMPEPVAPSSEPVQELDSTAQPKTVQVRSIQRINIHV
jgi:hypothetical protein